MFNLQKVLPTMPDKLKQIELAIATAQLHIDKGEYELAIIELDCCSLLLPNTVYNNPTYYETKAQIRELRDLINKRLDEHFNAPEELTKKLTDMKL